MLLGDFFTYKTIESKDGEVIANVFLNKNHSIYQGHFPKVPIVPGVCQTQILKEILSEVVGVALQLEFAKEIKFLTMLNPNDCDQFHVSITFDNSDEHIVKASSVFYSGDTKYFKFKGDFVKKNFKPDFSLKDKKCCVLIPTYNNATKLTEVLNDVLSYTPDVIVVNDGSTDQTSDILNKYPQILKVEYLPNKGKGHALQMGFKRAIEAGYEYAITMDSDGQHFAKDIKAFYDLIDENPNALLIGSRQLNQENVPGKSSFANKFSNFWFKVETGLSLTDTQSGYRMYPLLPLKEMKFYSSKYEFELEVLVRSSWKGIDVIPIPIDVYYPKPEDRITHFRPFKDFFRISVLNVFLVTLALLYYTPLRLIKKYRKKKLKQIIKEDILGSDSPVHIIALSIGFGVFMGIVPIWGYQLAVGFLLAHLFKLNKTVFFLAANISLPPLIPVILYLSYVTGGYILGHGSWSVNFDTSLLKTNLLQYVLGSIVLALASGSFFSILSFILIKRLKQTK